MTEVETARLTTEAARYDAAYRLDMRLGQIGTYLENLGLGDAGKDIASVRRAVQDYMRQLRSRENPFIDKVIIPAIEAERFLALDAEPVIFRRNYNLY